MLLGAAQTLVSVRAGEVRVVPGLVELTSDAARLADGTTHGVDAIVAATGYRPALDGLIGHLTDRPLGRPG